MSVENIIGTYRPVAVNAIKDTFPPDQRHSIPRYQLGLENVQGQETGQVNGKLIRSILFLTTAEGLRKTKGYTMQDLQPVVAALEMFHTFTLIHDDIEDNDAVRRGKPTVWAVVGQPQGINAGDLASQLAIAAVRKLDRKKFSAKKMLHIVEMFNETGLRLAYGQAIDLSFEQRENITLDEYMHMISGKTGAMIELPIILAATLQQSNKKLTEQLQQYAIALGRMFQLRDDYLGIWGEEAETGKSTKSDLLRRKKTYPIIHGLQTARETNPQTTLTRTLHEFYRKKANIADTHEAIAIREILETLGSRKATEQLLADYRQGADGVVAQMEINNQLRIDFFDLAAFSATRTT